jgi:hypothetical protein
MKLFARSKGDAPFARNHIGLNFFPGNQESLSLRVFVTVEIYESPGDVFDTARVQFEAAGFGASINFSPTCAAGYVDACFRAQPLRLDLVWYFLLSASDMQQTGHDPRLHPPVSRQCTDVAGVTCVPRAS